MAQVALASPRSLLMSVLHGSSIAPLFPEPPHDGDTDYDCDIDEEHLGDIDTTVEDKEDGRDEEQQGRDYDYTISISEEESEFAGERFVEDKSAEAEEAGGGAGMIRSEEDSTETSKEDEGLDAAAATEMMTEIDVSGTVDELYCDGAPVEVDSKRDNCPWPADVDIFSPESWGAPALMFTDSDHDWFRKSWDQNDKSLDVVGEVDKNQVEEVVAPGDTTRYNYGNDTNSNAFKTDANNNEKDMDVSMVMEAEADRMQPTSSLGSFEWDGIREEENASGEMDAKSKSKKSNDANEVRFDHQLQGDSITDIKSDCSTAYEGFRAVLDCHALSCKESRDESENDDDENSKSIGFASEGTFGTTTEFDPLSMFGEEENLDDVVFPSILDVTTIVSASGASTFDSAGFGSVFSESKIFPPLISGGGGGMNSSSQPKIQILHHHGSTNAQNGFPIQSPAGSESLESWWQSRYASTQNSDINSAVLEALTKRVDTAPASLAPASFLPQPSTTGALPKTSKMPDETTATAIKMISKEGAGKNTAISATAATATQSVRNNETEEVAFEFPSRCVQAAAVKDSIQPQKSQLQNQSLLSQSDEEDSIEGSIFSGLDDGRPPFNLVKNHQTTTKKSKERTPVNSTTRAYSHSLCTNARADEDILRSRIPSTGTEEDIFSGVSVSSQQQLSSIFPRLKESHAIKSVLDDSTLENPFVPQPPKFKVINYTRTELSLPAKQVRGTGRQLSGALGPTTELFSLEDKGFGVIDLQQAEHSPTNASITSDITSSVVFGYTSDVATKKNFLRRQHSILETHNEIVCDVAELHDKEHDESGGKIDENSLLYPSGGEEKKNMANRGVSLISFSTEEGVSNPGNSAMLSLPAAAASNEHTKLPDVENNTKNASNDGSGSSQSEILDMSTRSATINAIPSFLSQFSSCNFFAASSFACCSGAKGKESFSKLSSFQ
jgi:hypothetical protein